MSRPSVDPGIEASSSPSAPPGDREAAGRYTCGWCGRSFREDRGQPACRACPLTRLCGQVRCPHCGWENPARPGWARRAREDADGAGVRGWWRRLVELLSPDRGGTR